MKKHYYILLILLLCLPVLAHQYIKNFTPEIERIETLIDLNVKESFAPEIATFQSTSNSSSDKIYLYSDINTTLNDIEPKGDNVTWYSSRTGGSSLSKSKIVSDNAIFYAKKSNESTRTAVTTIKYDDKQEFCYGDKVADLRLPSIMHSVPMFYKSETDTHALYNDTPLTPGTYYADFHKTNEFAKDLIYPYSLVELADGRILIGGSYGDGIKSIYQVQADGTNTMKFADFTAGGSVSSMLQLDNGDILASNFAMNRVERFNKDGQLINNSFIKNILTPYGLIKTASNN